RIDIRHDALPRRDGAAPRRRGAGPVRPRRRDDGRPRARQQPLPASGSGPSRLTAPRQLRRSSHLPPRGPRMATIDANPPSGTRDFLPDEVARRERAFRTIREVFAAHGFDPLDTPAFERLEVLTGKYGEEGDQRII